MVNRRQARRSYPPRRSPVARRDRQSTTFTDQPVIFNDYGSGRRRVGNRSFFAVSEIADVLLLLGVLAMSAMAAQAAELLVKFAIKTYNATTEEELNEAAKYLAEAIAMLGVQIVMALLLESAPKVLNEARNNMKTTATPFTLKTIGEPPITEGKLFFEPGEVSVSKHNFPGDTGGFTDQWGRSGITFGRNATPKEIQIAKFHEEFHQWMAPKLQPFKWLRQTRAVLRANSYLKSYLLRYIEEALAETTARLRTNGFNVQDILEGFEFPLGDGKEGYVTVAKMKTEVRGILLGPVVVGGMWMNDYYSYKRNW